MVRIFLLSLFCLFVGDRCANAGVMLEPGDNGSSESAITNVASMSVLVAALTDTEDSSQWMRENNSDSMRDLSAQVSSVTAISGNAIAAVVDNIVPTPQVGFRLLLLNSAHPPSPDLDGLIKPPQVSCKLSELQI